MALIDVHCASCDRIDEVYRASRDWPETPACPRCGGTTEQIHLPQHMKSKATPDAVVVYRAPDGSYRFPPDGTTISTEMYDGKGFERVELRGWADVRRFEQQFNAHEMSEVRRRVERQQEAFERGESERRSEIRRQIEQGFQIPEYDDRGQLTGRTQTVRLSARGRDLLDHAMRGNDAKGGPKVRDVGFFSEAYSMDASNREGYSDGRGRRGR